MANGPMGGFMPTPPAPAQPPQVKLDTTASSRGTFNNFLKSMNGATSLNPPSMAPSMGVTSPMLAPAANIDIFNPPIQNFFLGGAAMSGGAFSDADIGSQIDSFDNNQQDDNQQSFVDDDPVAGFDFTPGTGVGGGGFDVVSAPTITGDEQQQNIQDAATFVSGLPKINFTNQSIENAFDALNVPQKLRNELRPDLQDRAKNNDIIGALDAAQKESAEFDKTSLNERLVNNIIQASNVNPANFSRLAFNQAGTATDVLGGAEDDLGVNLSKRTDTGLRGSLTPGASQNVIDTAKNAIRASAGNNLAIDNLVAQFGRLDPSIGELADRTKRGIGEIGQIKPGDLDDLSGTPTTRGGSTFGPDMDALRSEGALVDQIFDIDTRTTEQSRVGDDFEPALTLADRNEADRLAAAQALGVGTAPNLANLQSPTALGARNQPINVFDADAIMEEEEKFGTLPTKTLVDIERLSNVPIGQRRTGEGDDTPFFQGLGLPSIFDGIERFSRDRMAAKLARGDVPEKNIIRNDSGLVIGIKDNFGNLMEGRDPNAPIGSDDNDVPIIRRPIAPVVEEKPKDDVKPPPNIIGGTEPIVTLPVERPTVVASPFAPASSAIRPVTFDSGELNKLIELLTGVSAKPVVSAQEGGLIRAVDDFIATAG